MELDAGYVILRELLSDEARLDGILVIKSTNKATESLLRDISSSSGEMLDQLDQMAKSNPKLTMKFNGLPQVEVLVRDSIASRTGAMLLSSEDEEFEYLVLMTQDKALSYGFHLAKSLASMEVNSKASTQFSEMSKKLESLHSRVMIRLNSICGDD